MPDLSPFCKRVFENQQILEQASDSSLRNFAQRLREELVAKASRPLRDPAFQAEALAMACTAIKNQCKVSLFPTQIMAAKGILDGAVIEMATGEGKTLAIAAAAVCAGLSGRGIHIATPNEYLAERDHSEIQSTFESLGMSVGLVGQGSTVGEKVDAYDCDATYGPGTEFGFDYLRDRVAARIESHSHPGARTLAALSSTVSGEPTAQRGLAFSFVDEADHVLLDDAVSPLLLAGANHRVAQDCKAISLANRIALELQHGVEFTISRNGQQCHLTELGKSRVHCDDVRIPFQCLQRSWLAYVELALCAIHLFQESSEYVVQDGKICLVDSRTGRIYQDRRWQYGLHQAIEAKEGLDPSPEQRTLAQITRQRFYPMYAQLGGMTGTTMDGEWELRRVYGLRTERIAPRLPSRRKSFALRVFTHAEAKLSAIVDSCIDMHHSGRPVLIGTHSIRDSHRIADQLSQKGIGAQLLTGVDNHSESEVVANAGRAGEITVATDLAGRGTDIKLSDEARQLGGLHVVLAECHESARVDRQLMGRCARQGDPGSAQAFVSSEDTLIQKHAPWLTKIISHDTKEESSIDLSSKLRQIQRLAERKACALRMQLLEQSEREANLLAL